MEKEAGEECLKDGLYAKESREKLLENGAISSEEEGFMKGYEESLEYKDDPELEFDKEEDHNVT